MIPKTKDSKDSDEKLIDDIASMSAEAHQSFRQRLFKAQQSVRNIEKLGHNSAQNYDYVVGDDLLLAVKNILLEHNLILTMDTLSVQDGGQRGKQYVTRVEVEFSLRDRDSNLSIVSRYFGEGADGSDKGLPKAYTGAIKSYLRQQFLIATGEIDDAERDDENEARRAIDSKTVKSEPEFVPDGNPWAWMVEGGKRLKGKLLFEIPAEDLELLAEKGQGNDRAYARKALTDKSYNRIETAKTYAEQESLDAAAERVLGAKKVKTGTAHMGIPAVPFEDDDIPFV